MQGQKYDGLCIPYKELGVYVMRGLNQKKKNRSQTCTLERSFLR